MVEEDLPHLEEKFDLNYRKCIQLAGMPTHNVNNNIHVFLKFLPVSALYRLCRRYPFRAGIVGPWSAKYSGGCEIQSDFGLPKNVIATITDIHIESQIHKYNLPLYQCTVVQASNIEAQRRLHKYPTPTTHFPPPST